MASPPDTTFIPQRRHRKMLKDGTSEVWPEQAERLFMKGLREYWISPWATATQGRSRWRNQFLVDYLQKAGIIRTKKQVASHIQVLRNMLKGHPEHPDFRLVAIPEDLDSPPPSASSAKPKRSATKRDASPAKAYDSSSSAASSPAPSTPGSGAGPKNSVVTQSGRLTSSALLCSPFTPADAPSSNIPYAQPSANSVTLPPIDTPCGPRRPSLGAIKVPNTDPAHDSTYLRHQHHQIPVSAVAPPSSAWSPWSNQTQSQAPVPLPSTTQPTPSLTSVSFWADGMVPLNSQFDSADSRLCISLHIKLCVPAHTAPPLSASSSQESHPSSSASMSSMAEIPDGFHGAITLSAPWSRSAECVTRVYTPTSGAEYVNEERGPLIRIDTRSLEAYQGFGAFLPASSLSRCRSLMDGSTIMQYVYVDAVLVATFKYDLQRYPGAAHSAAITERYQWVIENSAMPAKSSPPPASVSSPHHPVLSQSTGPHALPSPPPLTDSSQPQSHLFASPAVSPTSPTQPMAFDLSSFGPTNTLGDLGFEFSSPMFSRSIVPTTW